MDILTLAKKLKIETPQFVDDYSNQFDDITEDNIDDIESLFDGLCDYISEYADSNTPIHYTDIDKQYDKCSVTIDDCIDEGLIQPMENEGDISRAKQCALYMEIERETYIEVEDFKKELVDAVDESKEFQAFECEECGNTFVKSEESKTKDTCIGCQE